MNNTFCKGWQCSVRNQCLRYTKRKDIDTKDTEISKCTNQQRFVQDVEQIKQNG